MNPLATCSPCLASTSRRNRHPPIESICLIAHSISCRIEIGSRSSQWPRLRPLGIGGAAPSPFLAVPGSDRRAFVKRGIACPALPVALVRRSDPRSTHLRGHVACARRRDREVCRPGRTSAVWSGWKRCIPVLNRDFARGHSTGRTGNRAICQRCRLSPGLPRGMAARAAG